MEDQHSQHSIQVETQHHKHGRLVRRLQIEWLSNTTNHKNSILKYEGLDNQLMHAASVYWTKKAYSNKMVMGHLPCSLASLLKVLNVQLLEILKVIGAQRQ
jgi:hypothetical protein